MFFRLTGVVRRERSRTVEGKKDPTKTYTFRSVGIEISPMVETFVELGDDQFLVVGETVDLIVEVSLAPPNNGRSFVNTRMFGYWTEPARLAVAK